MRKLLILSLGLLALAGCGEKPQPKAPAAAISTAKQFLASIKDKSPENYCATFLPSIRYGTVMGQEQDLCLQLAQAWMHAQPGDEQVIDAGEIKLAKDYIKWLDSAKVEVLKRGRVVFHFPNGGQLVLEQEQAADPQSRATIWKVDVDASGFTGP